ncbi:MAG: hypothetical protein ACT4OM_07090 [Actinomycetota bacterium]
MRTGRKLASFALIAALALPACGNDDAADEDPTEETGTEETGTEETGTEATP